MQTLSNLTPLLAVAVLNVTFGQTSEASDQTVEPAPDRKPLVLVAGATGKTGSIVVAELQARGFPVRAFVRDAAKAAERLGSEVEAVVGDLKDMASIVAALDGVGAVINAAGSGVAAPANNTPEKVDFEGARNLAEAAMDAGVGPICPGLFPGRDTRRSSSEQDVQQRTDMEAQGRRSRSGEWNHIHDRAPGGLERRSRRR